MSAWMRVTRIELDGKEMPEEVTVRMSRSVSTRLLHAGPAGCLMRGTFLPDQVTVTWPIAMAVKVAQRYGQMTPTDDVIGEVYGCLSSLCNRFWDGGVLDAERELSGRSL